MVGRRCPLLSLSHCGIDRNFMQRVHRGSGMAALLANKLYGGERDSESEDSDAIVCKAL